ncbi:MAG: hypothetical protein MJE68_18210 [Proteobacteria bacterium]|nr:hypothetical protein [Pseudomonadota bacterium]
MAEASSSGGEASEEEDDSDEASPSDGSDEASPSDGEITAANPRPPRHTNKRKELRYVQYYLQKLPKHQRKKIQKEVDEGYKPGELDRRYAYSHKLNWASTVIK